MHPNFDNMYNGFKEELTDMIQKFSEEQISAIQIMAENSWPTIFSTILNMVDPLIPKAGRFPFLLKI